MRIGYFNHSASGMFENPNNRGGTGDDLFLPLVHLKKFAERRGIECATVDMYPTELFDAFVFHEMPKRSNPYLQSAKSMKKPCYLIINENHFILKANQEWERYNEFRKVFTYNDAMVDGSHVLKLNYAFDLPQTIKIEEGLTERRKLAVMITSNWKRDLPHMIYQERRNTIHWFQNHHPESFDLYGLNWECGTLPFQAKPKLQRAFRRFGLLRFFPRQHYPSWCGAIERKRDVLGNYRFGFCYENTTEIPGYITEKIFDVMLAGTIPVYLGHENVGDHIPEKCFVNRAHFKNHEELYSYLSNMTEELYYQFLYAIKNFISGPDSYPFSIKCFIKTLLSEIANA